MVNTHPKKPKLLAKAAQPLGDSLQNDQSDLPITKTAAAISTDGQAAPDGKHPIKIGVGSVFAGPETSPPFPEGIVADRTRIYVAGPAALGDNGGKPSEVRVFHRITGELLATIPCREKN
ncbi:hypothetical protein HC928_04085 [bacterium]|nr:hypothetical protein [bacterium]